MSEEYIKKLKTMKPSEFIEEIFGIKLLLYQKIMIDTMDTKYQDKINEKLSGVDICQEH